MPTPDATGSASPNYQARHTSPTLEAAIRVLVEATAAYAEAIEAADRMDAEKAQVKEAAILRLIQTTNPLTKNPHSASSAEKVVEEDSTYFTWLTKRWRATTTRITAETMRDIALARVRFWSARGAEPEILSRTSDVNYFRNNLESLKESLSSPERPV